MIIDIFLTSLTIIIWATILTVAIILLINCLAATVATYEISIITGMGAVGLSLFDLSTLKINPFSANSKITTILFVIQIVITIIIFSITICKILYLTDKTEGYK